MRIKASFLILFLSLAKIGFSQSYRINDRTKIYTRSISSDSVVLKGDNDLTVPVTVKVDLILQNLTFGEKSVFVIIPAKTAGKTLATFYPEMKDQPFRCTYSWKIAIGDTSKTMNENYRYRFPYLEGSTFRISQGPEGSFSHHNMFAYDFAMPVGTPICAAREGIVALAKSDSDKGGSDRKYIEDANFITIYHEDGTLANYYHIQHMGVTVKEGDHVRKGQVIGYSGNTGFTSGPHLHFEITKPTVSTDKKQWMAFNWELPEGNSITMNAEEGR